MSSDSRVDGSRRSAWLAVAAGAAGFALATTGSSGAQGNSAEGAARLLAGTMTIGPANLATGGSSTLENFPFCSGGRPCTFIQWSGSAADRSYAAPVDGTIVAWRIASGSAGNKVKLRILRPVGGGKYAAVASSSTQTTSGSDSAPDQFTTHIPVRAGDIVGLDNSNDALIFKTGVLGEFPEYWTPQPTDGGSASMPTAPTGTTANGYELQIDAYLQPSPTTTSTAATTTTPTATTVTTVTTTTTAHTTPTPTGRTSLVLSGVKLSAAWRNSRLTGKVRLSITVKSASHLSATIRRAPAGRIEAQRNYTTSRGGRFQETLRLSPRTAPGTYVLTVRGTTGNSRPAVRATTIALKPPPEGIVDNASISLSRSGKAVSEVENGTKKIWARFHFISPPAGAGKVRIAWRTPSYKLVGAVDKPYASTVASYVSSEKPLAPGRWYAILTVNGTIVKRIGVKVS